MKMVRAKKHLGQHFLRDMGIAQRIADALTGHGGYAHVLEVGPGTGVLTRFLLQREGITLYAAEVDTESVDYLRAHCPALAPRLLHRDFLGIDLSATVGPPLAVIGNFPYNISSQIFFKVLENRDIVPEVVGMVQKEVADRIASPPGSRQYGILSVLVQAWYDVERLFVVPPEVFIPPPKVQSAVLRLRRNGTGALGCDERVFVRVVKAAFNQRRKTLRNALGGIPFAQGPDERLLAMRAEQLGVAEFVGIANCVDSAGQ